MFTKIKYHWRLLRFLLREIPLMIKADEINARYKDIPAKKNRVNIFEYHPERFYKNLVQNAPFNLGDSLGEVIIRYLLAKKGIVFDKPVSRTKHLYCVGTNIQGAWQSATIWGSGIYPPLTWAHKLVWKLSRRKLDVRAVRGPLTKQILEGLGFSCPNIFGDPAILMPMIYNPCKEKKYKYIVIPQFIKEKDFREKHPNEHMVSMNTNDYKAVIDEIVSSEMIITSSLHGIILAESYGVPAVFFRGLPQWKDFKYYDYYYSTGRKDIKIAESFEEALTMKPLPLPDLSKMRQDLLDSFPYNLWEQ